VQSAPRAIYFGKRPVSGFFLPLRHVLTSGRYVGAEEVEDDEEPFEGKMKRLTAQLSEQFAESTWLEPEIRKNLQ
jgi:hypothetical protein